MDARVFITAYSLTLTIFCLIYVWLQWIGIHSKFTYDDNVDVYAVACLGDYVYIGYTACLVISLCTCVMCRKSKDNICQLNAGGKGLSLSFKSLDIQHKLSKVFGAHHKLLPDFCYDLFQPPPPPSVVHVHPVIQPGYNSGPTIEPEKQRRLDNMKSSQYMDAIFQELSQEERENLMLQEKQRLRTFERFWPHETFLSPREMSKAGFYYLNTDDRVQCAFCRGILHQWQQGDVPANEHRSNFPFCRFMQREECGNQPYYENAMTLTADCMANIRVTDGTFQDGPNGSAPVAGELGIATHRAAKPEYAPEATRLRTYGQYPKHYKMTKERLCEAGFYYVGFNDTVKCFWCEGQLKDWAAADDPWFEHAKWFPHCLFLLSKKGDDFVKDARGADLAAASRSDAVFEYKKRQKPMSWIAKYCINLGHNKGKIEKVMRSTTKPFSSPKEMLEALYKLEDEEEFGEAAGGRLVADSAGPDIRREFINVPESATERMAQLQTSLSTDSDDRNMAGYGLCVKCIQKKLTIKASHVGLPCGCFILCDDCVQEVPERCPRCNKVLKGVMKVYTA